MGGKDCTLPQDSPLCHLGANCSHPQVIHSPWTNHPSSHSPDDGLWVKACELDNNQENLKP